MITKRIAVLWSVAMLIIGLVAGFLLYSPVSDSTGLHAGGLVGVGALGTVLGIKSSDGTTTSPTQWSNTQWGTFSKCVGTTRYLGKSSSDLASCVAQVLAGSPFAGSMRLQVSTIGRMPVADVLALTISKTGMITGTTDVSSTNVCPVPSTSLYLYGCNGTTPVGATITGYINPAGQINLTIGKSNLAGYVFKSGQTSKIDTTLYTGALLDAGGLASVPGVTLMPTAPFVTDGVAAVNVPNGVSIYEVDMWANLPATTTTPTPTPSPTADWQTYTNTEFGFSFKYPATGSAVSLTAGTQPSELKFFGPISDGGTATHLLSIYTTTQTSLLNFINQSFTKTAALDTNTSTPGHAHTNVETVLTKPINITSATIAGLAAKTFVWTDSLSNPTQWNGVVAFMKGSTVVTFSTTPQTSAIASVLSDAELNNIASTFAFTATTPGGSTSASR